MKHLPKDMLKWTAAAFALVATATAEYELARAIGMNEWVAAAVPGALDAYVVRALRAHREVLTAVLAMVAVNAASHLVTAGVLRVDWQLITAVSAIAPLVLWRVHALGTPGQWRRRKLWGLGKAEHAAVLASTDPEHGRAPDNPEPPGTREHPHVCYCGADVWGDLGAHQRAPWHPAEHTSTPAEHSVHSIWDLDSAGAQRVLDAVHASEHTSTDQERVRAQTDAWGDDWLDVHDAVHAAEHTSTPHLTLVKHAENIPVHAAEPWCGLASTHAEHEHGNGLQCLGVADGFHGSEHGELDDRDDVTGYEHTSTAEKWDRAHVHVGVLEPEDVEHMARARELFHTAGGQVPTFRALKDGTPGMGTPRAKRIRAALKTEAEAGGKN